MASGGHHVDGHFFRQRHIGQLRYPKVVVVAGLEESGQTPLQRAVGGHKNAIMLGNQLLAAPRVAAPGKRLNRDAGRDGYVFRGVGGLSAAGGAEENAKNDDE